MTRTQARELAFFIVFEHAFSGENAEEIIEKSSEARDLQVPDFSRTLADAVIKKKDELDSHIARLAKGWRLERISRVSRAILQVAMYEMLYSEDVPASVAINEAVNLCKTYAGEEDSAFVNGILGTLSREDKPSATEQGPGEP